MEMKNICGKIPVELHEKLKLEVEELGISIPKYLEMVIEEHMTRKVLKSLFASNCKNNIGYHNNCNHYQSEYI